MLFFFLSQFNIQYSFTDCQFTQFFNLSKFKSISLFSDTLEPIKSGIINIGVIIFQEISIINLVQMFELIFQLFQEYWFLFFLLLQLFLLQQQLVIFLIEDNSQTMYYYFYCQLFRCFLFIELLNINELQQFIVISSIILSMKQTNMFQIVTANGGSINFYKNQQIHKRYLRHLHKIQSIQKQKLHAKEIIQEQQKIANTLRKSKQIARNFKQKQSITNRLRVDRKMIQSLINIKNHNQMQPFFNSVQSEQKPFNKSINRINIEREIQIKHSNYKLGMNLIGHRPNVKEFRRNLKKQISEYNRLKKHAQRFKIWQFNSENRDNEVIKFIKIKSHKRLKTDHLEREYKRKRLSSNSNSYFTDIHLRQQKSQQKYLQY